MNRKLIPLLLSCLMVLHTHGGDRLADEADLASMSITQLETVLADIDSELENLSSLSLRGGSGAIGYRSTWEDSTQWIEIELDRSHRLDELVLVPCLWRHPQNGFQPDAFPLKMRILVGTTPGESGVEIAAYHHDEDHRRGIDPLIIPLDGTHAIWIRIEATELSSRNFDNHKVFQLSEVLVFSGRENVALHRPITYSSSDQRGISGVWHEQFLVDGFTPYIMDSSQGSRSNAFIARVDANPGITLDLKQARPISRIHLHTVEQNDTVPQAYAGDLGIPDHMRIEGALRADFSDAVELIDFYQGGPQQSGPIIIKEFPESICRYIRFTPLFENESFAPGALPLIGFSEIEILSAGENVALHGTVSATGLRYGQRSLSALTDGNNLYGKILPLREWMTELARRGALERQRPIVMAALSLSYDRQEKMLNSMIQLVFILIGIIVFVILIDRHFRMRKINQIRERIAADLHDELGANIHTIGLISDMAKKAIHSPAELAGLLDEIRISTEKSGEAARYCTNILEARGVCEDLVEEMSRFAKRTLADLHHDFTIKGKAALRSLAPNQRIDLLLFYKECLTNILRHSGATKVETRLMADRNTVSLRVDDNGKGLDASNAGMVPPSLQRRAKLLRASITGGKSASGGTRIELNLKTRKFRLFT